MSEVKNFHCMV